MGAIQLLWPPLRRRCRRRVRRATCSAVWDSCGTTTTAPAPSCGGFRFPPEIVSHAVWLYFRFSLILQRRFLRLHLRS